MPNDTPIPPPTREDSQLACDSVAEYRASVVQILMAARLLVQVNIPKLLESIEYADAFGCFTDPTLWIKNRGKMNEDREIIEAALPLYRMAMKIKNMPETSNV